jgi:hypothetical protein
MGGEPIVGVGSAAIFRRRTLPGLLLPYEPGQLPPM